MRLKLFVSVIACALAFLPARVSAQNSLSIELFGGKTYLSENPRTLLFWDEGWTAGLGIVYPILSGISLTANQSFSNFSFREPPQPPHDLMARPRLREGSVVNPFGPLRFHGDNSQMYRTSFGMQFTATKTSIRPFLSLETGVSVSHLSQITAEMAPDPRVIVDPSPPYRAESTSWKEFGSIGFGIFASLSSSIGVKVEGKWFDTWNNGDSYFPLTTTLSFQL